MCCKQTSWVELHFGKKKYVCIPHSFLVINVCNQGKNLCSSCIKWYSLWNRVVFDAFHFCLHEHCTQQDESERVSVLSCNMWAIVNFNSEGTVFEFVWSKFVFRGLYRLTSRDVRPSLLSERFKLTKDVTLFPFVWIIFTFLSVCLSDQYGSPVSAIDFVPRQTEICANLSPHFFKTLHFFWIREYRSRYSD